MFFFCRVKLWSKKKEQKKIHEEKKKQFSEQSKTSVANLWQYPPNTNIRTNTMAHQSFQNDVDDPPQHQQQSSKCLDYPDGPESKRDGGGGRPLDERRDNNDDENVVQKSSRRSRVHSFLLLHAGTVGDPSERHGNGCDVRPGIWWPRWRAETLVDPRHSE